MLRIIRESTNIPADGEIELDFDALSHVRFAFAHAFSQGPETPCSGTGPAGNARSTLCSPPCVAAVTAAAAQTVMMFQQRAPTMVRTFVAHRSLAAMLQDTLWQLDDYLAKINKSAGPDASFRVEVRWRKGSLQ